ncbi:MAG: chemotaxis protein CheW [Bacteriovorax sp.]|jgi:chemotaxis signal transduction protein
MSAKNIFEEQFKSRSAESQDDLVEENVYLQIVNNQSSFIIPIEDVREVAEYMPIKPYPVQVNGHLGVISIRGSVVPILSLSNLTGQCEQLDKNSTVRILILQLDGQDVFGIIAESVRKISLSSELSISSNNKVTIENSPVSKINAAHVAKICGEAA